MRLWSYCLAGFVFDWTLYVLWTVVPIHAVHLGAQPAKLACLQAASSVVYVAMCLLVGRLSDRVSKGTLLRLGCVGMIAACILVGRTGSLTALLLVMPLAGLSGSLFWPPVQAAIGAESKPERLDRSIGLFNVLWSAGKGLGFLTAGVIHGHLQTRMTLLVAAGGAAIVLLFYPWRDARSAAEPPPDPVDPAVRATFLRMAWIANFTLFGVGALLTNQFYKYVEEHRLGTRLLAGHARPTEAFFGLYLGLVYFAQTAVFAVVSRVKGWTYRRAPLYLTQLLLAAAIFSIAFLRSEIALLASAPFVGAGLGFGYAASIYYSLHTPKGHGKYAGIHEAVLGSGNIILPLGAGLLAEHLGDLRWPYWLGAGCAVAAIAAEEGIYRMTHPRGRGRMPQAT